MDLTFKISHPEPAVILRVAADLAEEISAITGIIHFSMEANASEVSVSTRERHEELSDVEQSETKRKVLARSIEYLGVGSMIVQILAEDMIHTIGDLLSCTERDLGDNQLSSDKL